MILIEQGTVNTVALTLREKATLNPPDSYLFVFENDIERRSKIFIGLDTSSFPVRYQEFAIEENAVEDLPNAVVQLEPEGFWTYTIYEQTGTTNLDPTDPVVGDVVEVGKVKVLGDTATFVAHTSQDDEIISYDG